MSRTFRRKNETQEYWWILRDWVYDDNAYTGRRINISSKSKEGVKLLVRYHSDAGTHACREPGPAWWRNLTSQRPLRRNGKEQLRKFMLDEEFVVIIEAMPPLEYWT